MPTKTRINGQNYTQLPRLVSDDIILAGLPQTAGAPDGYGDLAGSVNPLQSRVGGYYQNYGCVKIGGGGGTNAVATDKTLAATFVLKAKPARVRMHILNSNHLAPVTGVKAAISRSVNASTWYLPSVGLPGFRDFVFASNTIPAAGIATPNVVPTEIVSEWLNPYAVERTDGGTGWIVMLRVYQDAANIGSRMTFTGTGSLFDFNAFEGRVGVAASAGDFVKTSVVFNDDGASAPLFWLEVDYETPIASVAIVGDSIMQGANSLPQTNSACYGAAFLALQRLTASGKPAQLFNAGWSGATTSGNGGQMNDILSGYLGQFNSFVANGARPTIAAFCPWSVNNLNPYSVSALQATQQCIGTFISICRKNLINPVLVTPAPRNGLTGAEETARRAVVEYIKNYCAQHGILLIDRDFVYTDYSSSTGGYKLPEWCLDNIHPTYAGHLAESSEWESKLNQVL